MRNVRTLLKPTLDSRIVWGETNIATEFDMHSRIILAAFAASLATGGCTQTETTFENGGPSESFVGDVDRNPSTVEADVGTDTTFVGDLGAGEAPESFWVPSEGDFVLRDRETSTLWNLRGEAYEGPLAGATLRQVPAFNAFWFAWSVFYHGSEIWNRDEVNETAPIRTDGECLVPCDEIRLGCGGGKDCIPALDYDGRDGRPVAEMVPADDPGADYLSDFDVVLGVAIDGEARAYPHNLGWWHEIHNDRIGDTEFSVTFCPLTGSGLVFAGTFDGEEIDFGVSGNLYNSNLVMFDRQTDTLWSQLIFEGVSGDRKGEQLTLLPVVETTWKRWQQMYPDTLVASDDQGYSRSYDSYPYGDYRSDHDNTFRATNPAPDDIYQNKERILGIPGEEISRAYAMPEMAGVGDRVVINDRFEGTPIVVIYEAEHRMAIPFDARVDGQRLTFEGIQAP